MTRREAKEAVGSAYRERGADGMVQAHPAWWDLDAADRVAATEDAAVSRTLEAALDPRGLSSTAHTVLARIAGGRP